LRLAAKPSDEEHAYGHGKAEALSGVIQAVIIAMGGFWVVARAMSRIVRPEPVSSPEAGVAVSLAALAVSLVLVVYLRREARATQSIALAADAFHYVTDIATNIVAAIALVGYRILGWQWLDPVASIAIAVYIIVSAAGILRDAADELLDRGLPIEVEKGIRDLVLGLGPEVRGVRFFRSRKSGGTQFFEFCLLVDRRASFERSHDLAEAAAEAIRLSRGASAQVMVHVDPA
ncbi:MAG: cation diffusion facilitator family transporter, partial [Acidobacteriota bacterium]